MCGRGKQVTGYLSSDTLTYDIACKHACTYIHRERQREKQRETHREKQRDRDTETEREEK